MEARLSQRRAAAALTVSGNELSSTDEDSSVLTCEHTLSFKAACHSRSQASQVPDVW